MKPKNAPIPSETPVFTISPLERELFGIAAFFHFEGYTVPPVQDYAASVDYVIELLGPVGLEFTASREGLILDLEQRVTNPSEEIADTTGDHSAESPFAKLCYYVHHESSSAFVEAEGAENGGGSDAPLLVWLGDVGPEGASEGEFRALCIEAGWTEDQIYPLSLDPAAAQWGPGAEAAPAEEAPAIEQEAAQEAPEVVSGVNPPTGADGTTHAGFTGTQEGMTEGQLSAFTLFIQDHTIDGFHHGDCIGADADAAGVCLEAQMFVIQHPPDNDAKRAMTEANEFRDPLPYLDRNHAIVDETDYLICCPKGYEEEQRSGTWATVRYAREKEKAIIFIWPDGQMTQENNAIPF